MENLGHVTSGNRGYAPADPRGPSSLQTGNPWTQPSIQIRGMAGQPLSFQKSEALI